jgi:hypothetical protein
MKTEQTLYAVIGGELADVTKTDFIDPQRVEMVGIYPNYGDAEDVWRGYTQRSVDNAQMRYFVLPLHQLLKAA